MFVKDQTPIRTQVRWNEKPYILMTNCYEDEDGNILRVVKRTTPPYITLNLPQMELEIKERKSPHGR